MNTPENSKFKIEAQHLGPIISLKGNLSERSQNLIFARNGTGKSFLSRAFRYLDMHGQGEDEDLNRAAFNLVSDESKTEKGSFTISREGILGKLNLDKNETDPVVDRPETIFHVFSDDFVQEELRKKEYKPDGNILSQILVGNATIELENAQNAITDARKAVETATDKLRGEFEAKKKSMLIKTAGVSTILKAYRNLEFEEMLNKFPAGPPSPKEAFTDILLEIGKIKNIPKDPTYPQDVNTIEINDIDLSALEESLKKLTSPSSVAEAIKKKISKHPDFYKIGAGIVDIVKDKTCLFCEQDITEPKPKSVIEGYIQYFADEENIHKAELQDFDKALKKIDEALSKNAPSLDTQQSRYDALKICISSAKDINLVDTAVEIQAVKSAITALKKILAHKSEHLAVALFPPEAKLSEAITALNKIINKNNAKAAALKTAIEKPDNERKKLQGDACAVFERQFAIDMWNEITVQRALKAVESEAKYEHERLSKSTSEPVRERVASTFEALLLEFFGKKYTFDKENFTLKRGDRKMARGNHRTLSDGEKTAIAFCYFIACIHRKVSSDSDYEKLFLIFDDPVTSMSYDFVFKIAQTFKTLSISTHGDISLNPKSIDGNKCWRPKCLVLTHSSHFFNICVANRVVKDGAAFTLYSDGNTHKIENINKHYIAPFQEQLRDVYKVAHGNGVPDHTTGNSIRSVLEAVGRFCYPNVSDGLSNFLAHLHDQKSIKINSTLINTANHGSYSEEQPPSHVDFKHACEDTIEVVKKFAPGQIEILK